MSLFMVARIIRDKKLIGIRLLDTNSNQTKDVGIDQVKQFVSTGKVKIDNLQVVNNELTGVNGAIERYGIAGQSQSMTILSAIKNGDIVEGFRVSDSNGVVKTFRLTDIFKLDASGINVANGKICEKEGKKYLSAINGEYESIDIGKESKQPAPISVSSQQENVKQVLGEDICSIFEIVEKQDDGNGKKFIVKERNGRSGEVSASSEYEAANSYIKALLILAGVEKDVEYLHSSIVCTQKYMVQYKLPSMIRVIKLDNLSIKETKLDEKLILLAIINNVNNIIYLANEANNVIAYEIKDDLSLNKIGVCKVDAELLEANAVLAHINGSGSYSLCSSFAPDIREALVYKDDKLISVRLTAHNGKYVDISADAIIDERYPNADKDSLKTYNKQEDTCQLAEKLISYSRYSTKITKPEKLHLVGTKSFITAMIEILNTQNRGMRSAQYNQRTEGTEYYGALESSVYKKCGNVVFLSEANSMDNQHKKEERMKELVEILNKARKAYEQEDREIMSNFEYDKLYDELLDIEKELGYALKNSPTQNVGYEVVSKLQKEQHSTSMLSLDKTKDVTRLKEFLGDKTGLLSWKMDGLTVVLTYRNGELAKAVTRGNGEVGEIVTHNARQFKNIPKKIKVKGELIVRGEAIIKYSEFEKVNAQMPVDAQFKNPRNLCSGSVRQLDSKIAASRNIEFYAFKLVKCDDYEPNTVVDAIRFLKDCGFDFVASTTVNRDNIGSVIESLKARVKDNDIPSDGLVLTYNDIKYGASLGNTGKFPRHSIAFKWKDELAETTITGIEWSCSRTGLINPIALFVPVDIEGSTVGRASIHNVSIMKELELGVGDTVTVYKANMIIPQIADNLTRSDTCRIPDECPVCGAETEIKTDIDSGVETLYCTNEDCPAKGLRLFTHFVARDAMNIDGLSIATLGKLMDEGFVNEFADIYKLEQYKYQIINMEGFGVKSYDKLIASVDRSRNVKLANLIYALGIPNVGLQTAKLFVKAAKYSIKTLMSMGQYDLLNIAGVGDVIAYSFYNWFHNSKENAERFVRLYTELDIIPETESEDTSLKGLTFCCTGGVDIFANRNQLKEIIESKGGKLTGSVTSNTSYLVTNDTTSGSTKNKEAARLGVPILSEQQFIDKFGIQI